MTGRVLDYSVERDALAHDDLSHFGSAPRWSIGNQALAARPASPPCLEEQPAESHRRELQVHCYRMLGSFQDAEDAVQETKLAAWQGIGGFAEERASLRTWLYKIATNRCLNARRAASRRPAREWDMSQFEPRVGVGRPRRAGGPADRRRLHRHASGAIRIRGPRRREPVLGPPVRRGRRFDLVPTRANGQPAFGAYLRGLAGIRHATGLYVLTLAGDRICAMTRFEASVLPSFGLPRSLPSR